MNIRSTFQQGHLSIKCIKYLTSTLNYCRNLFYKLKPSSVVFAFLFGLTLTQSISGCTKLACLFLWVFWLGVAVLLFLIMYYCIQNTTYLAAVCCVDQVLRIWEFPTGELFVVLHQSFYTFGLCFFHLVELDCKRTFVAHQPEWLGQKLVN